MKVAVVGNGPSATGAAEQIDSCDVVVRVRAFWKHGALDAGSKTTAIAWFGSVEDMDADNMPSVSSHWLTHCPDQILLMEAAGARGEDRMIFFSRKAGLSEIRWLPTALWNRLCSHLNSHPSTGFVAVAMAMEIYHPTELCIFGFDAFDGEFSDARREIPIDQQMHHNMAAEKIAIAEIAQGTWLGTPLEFPCYLNWPSCPPSSLPAFPHLRGVVAFIHVKGTSSRVPGKAMRMLGDEPLFLRPIKTCQKCPSISAVVIDSNSQEIRDIGTAHGALPLPRPSSLATNATAGDQLESWAAYHAPNSDVIAVVIPTSPFLLPATIESAITMLLNSPDADSVAAVRRDKMFLWKQVGPDKWQPGYGNARTGQSLLDTVWETTGLYVTRTQYIKDHHQRINYNNCLPLEISPIESIDINTEGDFDLAVALHRGLTFKET
jgi:CMP-N-acetylneuraminic acid synthetase